MGRPAHKLLVITGYPMFEPYLGLAGSVISPCVPINTWGLCLNTNLLSSRLYPLAIPTALPSTPCAGAVAIDG